MLLWVNTSKGEAIREQNEMVNNYQPHDQTRNLTLDQPTNTGSLRAEQNIYGIHCKYNKIWYINNALPLLQGVDKSSYSKGIKLVLMRITGRSDVLNKGPNISSPSSEEWSKTFWNPTLGRWLARLMKWNYTHRLSASPLPSCFLEWWRRRRRGSLCWFLRQMTVEPGCSAVLSLAEWVDVCRSGGHHGPRLVWPILKHQSRCRTRSFPWPNRKMSNRQILLLNRHSGVGDGSAWNRSSSRRQETSRRTN